MNLSYLNTSVLKFNVQLNDPGFGGDAVILDLEDSVHNIAKMRAREVIATLDLSGITRKDITFGVRINSLYTIEGVRDIDIIYACCESGSLTIDFLQLPKVKSHYDIQFCKALLEKLPTRIKIIPIIEIPEAVENVDQIAALSDAMMFGQVDMTASMYQINEAYLSYARGRFCVACAKENIAAIDTTVINQNITLNDMSAFEKECIAGKAEGFTAKAVIHPAQIPIVNKIFAATQKELEQYHSIVSRYEKAKEGFSIIDGMVIAPPFVARAKMMLRLYNAKPRTVPETSILSSYTENIL
jgi:citrate lyase subunit beta/citryl-CoA lyase/(S)-citramalyl-CoA lyase